MEVIAALKDMQRHSEQLRNEGNIITFVPTMGYLHEGHLSLMREGRKAGDILIMSIFVNPTQFGPGEDYAHYPHDLERDLGLAQEVGVDIVFTPSSQDMYPAGFQTYVDVEHVTKTLCGISRPHHFRGVTTVVTKLFNIVKPHIAIFGQKDYQQLVTIKRMADDLNMDIEIIGLPTVRETDDLAMSSRNTYLNVEERKAAQSLYRSLSRGEELFRQGVRDAGLILDEIRQIIEAERLTEVDYAKICDPQTLEDVNEIENRAVIALAVKVGETRLIDNVMLGREG